MLRRSHVYAIVAIATIAWTGLLLIQGVDLQPAYLKPYSTAVTAVIICFEIFNRWLWRLGPIPRLIGCDVLHGTWRGTLQSTRIDPVTHRPAAPISSFLVIRQTYSRIDTRLFTAESSSASLVASLDSDRNAEAKLQWTYRNIPGLLIQDRSRIHHGAVVMDVHGSPPSRLTGYYWTDRDTKGTMSFGLHSPKLHTDFREASVDPLLS